MIEKNIPLSQICFDNSITKQLITARCKSMRIEAELRRVPGYLQLVRCVSEQDRKALLFICDNPEDYIPKQKVSEEIGCSIQFVNNKLSAFPVRYFMVDGKKQRCLTWEEFYKIKKEYTPNDPSSNIDVNRSRGLYMRLTPYGGLI